ncbi:MAG: PD40 domain-containing protein [Flavobacteriaceae bacterium]
MKKIFLACIIYFLSIQIALSQKKIETPNKLKIAFVSYKTGTAEIYLMNADGSDVEQITDSKENNSFPFQIDKRTIGFTRTDSLKNQEKFKIDIITKKEQKIRENPIVNQAKWETLSSDKKLVAFVRSNDYRDRELYIYNTLTKKEIKISDKKSELYKTMSVGFSWSKNGKYLIFMSGPDWFNQFIRMYDVEKEKVVTITERGFMNSGIKWLNDNETLIANLKIRGKTLYEIYSVNIKNGKLAQLTKGINLHPDVSPNGEWVVFESQRHNNYGEVYIMKKDGTEQRRLTNNENYNGRCIWFKL